MLNGKYFSKTGTTVSNGIAMFTLDKGTYSVEAVMGEASERIKSIYVNGNTNAEIVLPSDEDPKPIDPSPEKEPIVTHIFVVTGSGDDQTAVSGASVFGPLGNATTDENGKATLTFYKGETAIVTVKKDQYVDSEWKFIANGNQQTVRIYPVGINISITVVDTDGNPMPGATVSSSTTSKVTDDDGKTILSFTPGKAVVTVSKDRYLNTTYSFIADCTPQTITLRPNLAKIKFRVFDPFNEPVSGVSIIVGSKKAFTDNNGEAVLGVLRGDNTYVIECDGYTSVSDNFSTDTTTLIEKRVFPEPNPADDFEYTIENGEVTITKCIVNNKRVVVPNSIEGYPVKAIGYKAFFGCTELVDAIILEGVTTLGYKAFGGCTNLNRVYIPSTLANVYSSNTNYWGVFNGCSSLKTVVFGNGISIIPRYLFEGCTGLESITMPNSVTKIGEHAFDGCKSLTEVSITGSVTFIGNRAFYNCNNLTIYAPAGSYAELYATTNSIPFVSTSGSSTYSVSYSSLAAPHSSNTNIGRLFADLVPGGIYNIYVVKDRYAEDPLYFDNLLYITQTAADSNGTISLCCELREEFEDPQYIIKRMGKTDIANAVAEISEPDENKLIVPTIFCNDDVLKEGTDYFLSGRLKLNESGSYEFTIIGTNDYYGTKTFSYSYTAPDVTSIILKTEPSKLTYSKGDQLDLTGAVLTVTYSDGSTNELNVTESMAIGFDSTSTGTQIITVTYGGKTCSFTVTVRSGSSGGTSGGSSSGGSSGGGGRKPNYSDNSENKISATLEYRNIGKTAQPGTLEKVFEDNQTFFKTIFESHAIGCRANLMKQNGDKLEFISAAQIQKDGSVLLPYGEAEKYFVIVDKYTYLTGDANDDLVVNALDASAVLKHIVGIAPLTENQLSTLDCNDDGSVNALDASWILKKAVGLIA